MSVDAAPVRLQVDGEPQALVPADDRGLLYGDGVFRTLRVVAGRPWLLKRHLHKLAADASVLSMALDAQLLDTLRREIAALVAHDDGILRITLTHGSGPRGYARFGAALPRRILAFTPASLPVLDPTPVRMQLARTPLACSPALAGVKHLGRLEQVLATSEPAAPEVFERLMCDPEGQPVCGTRCNLFLRCGRLLLTPALERAGVAGVVRGLLLEGAEPVSSGYVDECRSVALTLADLVAADELFLSNAVFGLRVVNELLDVDGGHLLRRLAPGPLERHLFSAFAADFAAPGSGA